MAYADIFGAVGVLLSLMRYATYLRAIYRGTTVPHIFTWLNAALMSGIAFFIQLFDHAGPGIWTTGVVAFSCAAISGLAVVRGSRDITRGDWLAFLAGLAIIPIWAATETPFAALALVLLIELFGYYPTARKSYLRPFEEDLFSWFLSALRWAAAALAVSNITALSLLYPVFIAVCETAFVLYLFWRQRVVSTRRRAKSHA